MSEEHSISRADLSSIESSLSTMESNLSNLGNEMGSLSNTVSHVSSKVEEMADEVSSTQKILYELAGDFATFVKKDSMDKAFQMAQTQIIAERQEFEKNFGQYAEVRKLTVGILQATDLGIVRSETMRRRSEESMLNIPRYWLGPGLIALSAWLANDRPLAEKAMAETVRRDDNKASLYFALISRRGNRRQASAAWCGGPIGRNRRIFAFHGTLLLDVSRDYTASP